jgi:GNAT superfamily N-acetyltransferase
MSDPPRHLTIAPGSLAGGAAQALIERLNAELTERYPSPEDRHFGLSEEQVAGTNGVFLVAALDGEAVGCGALRRLDDATGELKRMYVAPEARRLGVGRGLLDELERRARGLGLRRLVLETGLRQHEAMAMYERAGYARIECFGEYEGGGASVCMEKLLAERPGAVVRKAGPTDVDALVQLCAGLFAEDGARHDPAVDADWPARGGRDYFGEAIGGGGTLVVVADVDGSAAGYLVGRMRDPMDARPVRVAVLESMYVLPVRRREGVGAALVGEFRAWAGQQRADRLSVTAYAANAEAIRFYEREGFALRTASLEAPA